MLFNKIKIISHRANINGPDPKIENHPDQIIKVAKKFDVEIDVWYLNNCYSLGHDYPMYEIQESFLMSEFLWCHAKNFEAMERMLYKKIHCFWHEEDKMTVTSKGIPWCYPNHFIKNGITVIKENYYSTEINILGVCTDYPISIMSAKK